MKTVMFLCLSLVVGMCRAQDLNRMEQVIQAYVGHQHFMGSVLVARGNDAMLSKGYGFANVELKIPNSPETKFRLGSITKQFTAASIVLLEQQGKLKTEDPVKKYLPDAPATWDKITIFHLLTHTSGIPEFMDGYTADFEATKTMPATPEQLVSRFRDKPLDFAPGEKFSYSNSGYVLLGYLIEKISGHSYAQFVQENLFTPLGMKDSGYDDSNSAIIVRRASGYVPGSDGPMNAGFVSIAFSAGGLYSTTEDLLRWEQGLFGGKVLSEASLRKMTTPIKGDYAFGLVVSTLNGRKAIWHGGTIQGFSASLVYYPEDKLTVAVLGNLNWPAPDEIASKLGALAHGEKVELPSGERKEITLSRDVLSRYTGTYDFEPGVIMLIKLEGGQLSTKLGGQPWIPIYPESETMFFLKVVDAQLEFRKDTKGAVTGVVMHQGGGHHHAPRKSSTIELPPERKAIVVLPGRPVTDETIVQSLAGRNNTKRN